MRFLTEFADAVDSVNGWIGKAAAWLYPLLVVVVVVNVVLRYFLGLGLIELEEIQWHLFAAAFLLGFAWTYAEDGHVRVDVLRQRLSVRAQAWIECLGCLLLLFPFSLIIALHATDFFWQSWLLNERSNMPSGLPARYVIKLILTAALFMLSLQSLSVGMRHLLAGTAKPRR